MKYIMFLIGVVIGVAGMTAYMNYKQDPLTIVVVEDVSKVDGRDCANGHITFNKRLKPQIYTTSLVINDVKINLTITPIGLSREPTSSFALQFSPVINPEFFRNKVVNLSPFLKERTGRHSPMWDFEGGPYPSYVP